MNNAHISIHGTVVKDAQINQTKNGGSFVSFTVAVLNGKKDENGNFGSDFHNVSYFGEYAKLMAPKIVKGARVNVFGTFSLGTYKNKEGKEVPTINDLANDVAIVYSPAKTSNNNVGRSSYKPAKESSEPEVFEFEE